MLETLFRHLDMVRLSASVLVMIVAVGCTGLIDGGSDGLTRQERAARKKWEATAYPVFRDNCATCHAGSRPNIEFLLGATALEVYDSIKAYDPPVMNVDAPGSSRVLSKGQHDGPALNAEQSGAILSWLQAERDAAITKPADETQLLATAPFAVQLCPPFDPANPTFVCPTVNRVPLETVGKVGPQIPGAEITFTAHALMSGLYVSNLKISGGTSGAYIEHPLFVSRPAMGDVYPDQIDRFFNLKMNVKATVVEQLSGGTAVFSGFVPTDMLEIHFRVLSAFKPDTGPGPGGPGGCKVLPSFKINAAPALRTYCASCHTGGANPNAKAAMDITGIAAADDTSLAAACAQVRTRINLTTTDQSGFFLTPNPASGINHPFKFPDAGAFTTSFKTPVDIWVQAEKVAP
jgi:mono/diheme cytochrome c family protein